MGAGASVAHELSANAAGQLKPNTSIPGHGVGPVESQYNEMVEHLRDRFTEEVEVMQAKYDGEIDLDVLLCRLLQKELVFSAIEKDDLPALTQRRRDEGKIYVLGDSNFLAPADAVVVSTVTPKALGLVGDEQLSVVAREALPANAKVNKKAVELMGSTKVVTEKKALKRLGSEMTENMRAQQVKSEKRELKANSPTANRRTSTAILFGSGGGGSSVASPAKSAAGSSSSSDSDGDEQGEGGAGDAQGVPRMLSGIGSRLRSPSVLLRGPAMNMKNVRSSISTRSHSTIMWSPSTASRRVAEGAGDIDVAALAVPAKGVGQQPKQEATADPSKPPDEPS